MTELSEKEQIEQIRTWWSEYGNWVIGGVIVMALGLFGFNHVKSGRVDAQYAASARYSELTDLVVAGNVDEAEALTGEILSDFGNTAYAAQAQLALARLYMDKSRDEDAANTLRDLAARSGDEEFAQVARLRLAKILLYQDKAEEALDVLGAAGNDGAFAARYDEVRGDAYVALDRLDEARDAYTRALGEASRQPTIDTQFVQLKLLDLPIEETVAAVEEAGQPGAAAEDASDDVEPDAGDEAVE